jgi:hypothetical protein
LASNVTITDQVSFSVYYDGHAGKYRGAGDSRYGEAENPADWALSTWPEVSGPNGNNDTSTSLIRHDPMASTTPFIAFVREQGLWNPGNGNQVLRRIGYTVSGDFQTWTQKQPIPELDSPDGGWTQPYALSATSYKGKIVGLLWWLHLEQTPGNNKYGTVDAELIWADSPDGPWTRTHTPFLPSGAPGEMDYGMAAPAPFVVHDGIVFIYYTCMKQKHGVVPLPGETNICLATMPQTTFDEIVGLTADVPAVTP